MRFWVLLLLLLVSCRDTLYFTGLSVVPFTPPTWYREAWVETVACAGKHAKPRPVFRDVRWFVVERESFVVGGRRAVGMEHGWRIYLAQPYLSTPWVVKHEMLHAITGINNHPDDPFRRCRLMKDQ